MALEAVVFKSDPFRYGDCLGGSRSWDHSFGFGGDDCQQEKGYAQHDMLSNGNIVGQGLMGYCLPSPAGMRSVNHNKPSSNSKPDTCTDNFNNTFTSPMATTGRRKRRRTRNIKNKEEVETQRITHIAVERNRRKLMNDYLATLRSMMPASYAQRGDQASIIGGAINFVKELEQLLQSLEASRKTDQQANLDLASIFSNFFTFPQYSTCSNKNTHGHGHGHNEYMSNNLVHPHEIMGEKRLGAVADVEVTMVESHANIKVLLRRHPRQLLKMVLGLHSLSLIILHLNVTAMESMILYSFSVKVEDNSKLTSMNEIAADVYEMVGRIQEEAEFLPQ